MSNMNFNRAKKSKNDEFYTQLSIIENELSRYPVEVFRDKIIYCPCDMASVNGKVPQSQFVKYFIENFEKLQYKKLIVSCLLEQTNSGKNLCIIENINGELFDSFSVLEYDDMWGSGDFRSNSCLKLLEQSDLVITNPPFSLLNTFFQLLIDCSKDFIILGIQPCISYKNVFNYFRDNKVRFGYTIRNGHTLFDTPSGEQIEVNVRWFTNLVVHKPFSTLILHTKSENEQSGVVYKKYDNYDAINCDKTSHIPSDYKGYIGVPITFLDYYNPNEFELVDILYDAYIDGIKLYTRIVIK